MTAIGKAHAVVHQLGVSRVQTTITAGTRYEALPVRYWAVARGGVLANDRQDR